MNSVENWFRLFRGRAYRWAFAACRRHEESLDAVQEAFSRLIRERPALKDDRAAGAWLRRVVVGVVIDAWRKSRRMSSGEGAETDGRSGADGRAVEARVVAGEEVERIRGAMETLSDRQRLVLIAKCCDGMTFAEIGEELGIATPTVKTHYARALEVIRDRMGIASATPAEKAAPARR